MAEKKSQHYVPKFLLTNFSFKNEKTHIGVYNPETDFFKNDCALRSQAQEDYFYGADKVVENILGDIENNITPLINKIISSNKVPIYGTEDHKLLFYFTLIMMNRTKSSAERLQESASVLYKEVLKNDKSFNEADFEIKNAATQSIIIALERATEAYDMGTEIIINNTKTPFIISDNPVVSYNQFLENRKHVGGHLGIFAKGLQIFFPIHPTVMLVFYDKWAYIFGKKDENPIIVNNPYDINKLNSLQIINCFNVAFFNDLIDIQYLKKISTKHEHLRKGDLMQISEIQSYTDSDCREHKIYHSSVNEGRINLELSFIKPTKKSITQVLTDRIVQVRDERVLKNKSKL